MKYFEVREAKTKELIGVTDEKGLQYFMYMITEPDYFAGDGIPGDPLGFPNKFVFVGPPVSEKINDKSQYLLR